MPRMGLARPGRGLGTALMGVVALVVTSGRAEAQTEQFSLRGDRVSIYNLVGSIRVEGAAESGGATSVEVIKRGSEGARLRVETGVIRGRETLRVIYPERRISFSGERGTRRGWFDQLANAL